MSIFENIILNGRPAGGKSELIDFIKNTPLAERRERFHIGELVEIDDFVWLWDKFVEDDLWEKVGEPRLYSTAVPGGYVQHEGDKLLDMLICKFSAVVERDFMGKDGFYDDHTVFVEFARGVADGGFKRAYPLFSKEVLERSVILYIKVSYEESRRRNEARYQEALAHSILAHKLPEEALQRFSAGQDWDEVTGGRDQGTLDLHGVKVPFVTLNNEPELKDPVALNARYSKALQDLMKLHLRRHD
ncbi:MAG: hypothetical protein AUK47_09105 [Deltaproteobacteria bacterium CG2_30_63_29]|nr:MAG: hypothetical protein AUK47_09105 [Deltaproteobacteria bacterium CG2_30_63_29]PJB42305.1 MAG: hypothetical protein CO108_11845 [Deltaproteobacteria bacterium CG_4_9_14_3_um_filter_63_12]